MSDKTTLTLLNELSQSQRPEQRGLGKDILGYLQDRSPDYKPIPMNDRYWAWELSHHVCATLASDETSHAVLEYVCLSIKLGASPESDLVKGVLAANEQPGGGVQLLKAAQCVGLSDLDLAKYWMSSCGHRLSFGWVEERPEETLFGSAYDVRIFYEIPPNDEQGWSPAEHMIWNLTETDTVKLLQHNLMAPKARYGNHKVWHADRFQGTLAKLKPHVLRTFLDTIQRSEEADHSINWSYVLTASESFDDDCVRYVELSSAEERLDALVFLDTLRKGKFKELGRRACLEKENKYSAAAFAYLADNFPADLIVQFNEALKLGRVSRNDHPAFIIESAFKACGAHWEQGGHAAFTSAANQGTDQRHGRQVIQLQVHAIHGLAQAAPKPSDAAIRQWCLSLLDNLKQQKANAECLAEIWSEMAPAFGQLLVPELWTLLQNKSKILKTIAVAALKETDVRTAIKQACELLSAKKMDARIGGAMLLGEIPEDAAISQLKSALETEESDKVRSVLFEALANQGVTSQEESDGIEPEAKSAQELEVIVDRQAKKIKLPKGDWLKLSELPPLRTSDGATLSELALTYLIQKQSKHKAICAAGDVQPFLHLFDRAQTTTFALALFQQWLDSEQSASDRWVLSLTGLLADSRAIPELTKPIKNWAENARHKLAEYAAQAVALIPGDSALMVLDGLANRYRSKFKNIGRACREALNAAALDRGVSMDELGDMIVPTFDFDEVGQRPFRWEGASYLAQLGPDFKLSWIDAETENEQKSMPASMPAEVKDEVKALNKLIREAVKGQTQRLELNLVRQRRWEAKRWSELFEKHPLLQSFAANLVWACYGSSDQLRRTFRRYPNGLLANAKGELIELDADDKTIGMIHPLELETSELDVWKEHLGRFKVKPPFPQLERPLVLLE
ncbi:MAG: DUF4132 domain-containing protein, partial [Opitutales bacterium]